MCVVAHRDVKQESADQTISCAYTVCHARRFAARLSRFSVWNR